MDENSEEIDVDQTVSANKFNFEFDDVIEAKIISFFRQALCCGIGGLFLAPYVSAIADVERLNAETDRKLKAYFDSHENQLLRFWEFRITGLLLGALFTFSIGRRYSVILSNLLLLIAVLVLSYKDKFDFLKSDAVNIHCGMGLLVASYQFQRIVFVIYAAEVTNSVFRGFFIGLFLVCYTFGLRSSYVYRGSSRYIHWNTLNAYLAIGNFIISLFVPETPFWLVQRGRRDEAIARFQWIRAGRFDDDELEIMLDKAEEAAVQRTSVVAIRDSFISGDSAFCWLLMISTIFAIKNLFPLMIAWIDSVLQVRSIGLIGYFPLRDLRPLWWQYNMENFGTFIRALLPFFGAPIFLVSNFFIQRKALFLGSIIMQCIFLIGRSSSYIIRTYNIHDVNYMGRFGYLCYMYAYIGAIPVSMILPVEIFPAVTREIGVTINYFMDCSLEVLHGIYVLYNECNPNCYQIDDRPPEWTPYARNVEFVLLPIGLLLTLLFVPETQGLTLEEAAEAAQAMKMRIFANINTDSSEENNVVEE